MLQIAIVGSGPAGCYAAGRLSKLSKDTPLRVDVLDRLPTPYGLVRAGVAPDHQSTKRVARVMAHMLSREPVRFFGNVTLGDSVSLEELQELYDAVILAVGAPKDRKLGIPGEDLTGVIGSAAFCGWYNSHPPPLGMEQNPDLSACRSAVIVGVGNVAVDVVRILAKTPDEYGGSDIDPGVVRAIAAAPLESIHVVGRRAAADAKFYPAVLRELIDLARARPAVDPVDLPPPEDREAAHLSVLRAFAGIDASRRPVEIRFHFNASPNAIEGDGRCQRILFDRNADAAPAELPADLVVTCIGYQAARLGDLKPRRGILPNEEGCIADRLWVVGWAKHGPVGTIATNRRESQEVVDRVVATARPGGRAGRDGLIARLDSRDVRPVGFDDWERIEQAEINRAAADRIRYKFRTVDEMLDALNG